MKKYVENEKYESYFVNQDISKYQSRMNALEGKIMAAQLIVGMMLVLTIPYISLTIIDFIVKY